MAVRSTGESRTASPGAVRGHVLVVDDDDGVRRVLRRALDDHDVLEAKDGVAALSLLGTVVDLDLILCDVVMPNMGGVGFWSAVAASYPALLDRIVFMTGGGVTPEEDGFLSAGIAEVIHKPFSFEELRRFVAGRVRARRGESLVP